jgi:hypothetical protein
MYNESSNGRGYFRFSPHTLVITEDSLDFPLLLAIAQDSLDFCPAIE